MDRPSDFKLKFSCVENQGLMTFDPSFQHQRQKVDLPDMAAKNTPFQPAKLDSKADRTNRAAREIIRDAEDARQAKTERLRAKRLERDAVQKIQKKPPAG